MRPVTAVWRAGADYLVERSPGVFVVIDPTGAVTRHFKPTEWSIDDDLGREAFVVEDGALRKRTTIQRRYGDLGDEEVVLADLELARDPESLRFVATALADREVVDEEERLRIRRAADARVAAIDGALADHGRGEAFARAQHALRDRVHRYDDTLAASLLRTLIALARADASPPAIAAYVRGCLHACFAFDVPDHVDGEPVPAAELAAELADRAHELATHADMQSWFDANDNARRYRLAADAVRAAARLLGG